LLEPHIKEGRGGMRDIQAMIWTAGVVFGLHGLDDIQSAGLLDETEKISFVRARAFIFRLRGYLHSQGRRKNDQLYFEHQEDMAGAFGYRNEDGLLAVERFMRDVYGALEAITVISDLFFDHVDEVLGLVCKSVIVADKEVEKGIEIKSGRIHLSAGYSQLQAKPQILLRIFLAMARTGLPMHHKSRKVVAANLDLITEKLRHSPRAAKTFFALLLDAEDIFLVLETMLETGVLVAYIPEFSRIATLAQHDLYHIYTVDRHSLQAVAELHKLMEEWREDVVHYVQNPKVLYVAALLHDIGKGSGKDHSLFGEELVGEIGRRLCFSEDERSNIQFLVRYHLFIPENALRRDLNDAVFIQKCAETIGDADRLSMLYLLSVADSKATGPSAWSDWKATLMEEMYLKVRAHLDFGRHGVKDVLAHEEEGVEWLREQVRGLVRDERDLRVDIDTLAADYILSFSPEMIAEHIRIQRDSYQLVRQKSLVVARETEESWSLLIMTTDRPGLLAKICGVMALNNLSVTKAQIFTWTDGTVVDVVDVRSIDGVGFEEKDWPALNEQLNLAVEHRMGLSHRLYRKLSPTVGRRQQMVGDVDSRVVVDNSSSDSYSVIEVYGADLPGHLYQITQAMADFGINIYKAYIATEVEQLIDVFYVLDSRGEKLLDEEYRQEIVQGILHSIGCVEGSR
jgi:[protein-PII] uridylyltransferase